MATHPRIRRRAAWRRTRRLALRLAVLVAFAVTPIAAQDLPGPAANLLLIPRGSLVIPMDNAKQSLVAPFNLKAYGLVNDLLQQNIPVKWAIRAGKAKDATDFTAQAQQIAPTTGSPASLAFSGGPFIVHESYAALARARIAAFGGNVAVYELTQDVTVDIRYELTFKPRPFVNSTNASLATDVLIEAGITTYAVGSDFSLLSGSCYTIAMEPHNTNTSGVAAIRAFVESGGNFLAQCASIPTYENDAVGRFLTTLGIAEHDVNNVLTYPNPDLSFSQFLGALEPAPGGSVEDWQLAAGSAFKSGTHVHADNVGASPPHFAAMAGKLYAGQGGLVYYLGGHDWGSGSTTEYYNGRRMVLNAVLTPPTRPLSCGLSIALPDLTVAKSHGGNFVEGRTGTYTITVSNAGTAATLDTILVTDTLPSGLSYSSATGTGWTFSVAGSVVTARYVGAIAAGANTSFTLTVTTGPAAVPSVTNRVRVSGGGEVNTTNNTAQDPTTVVAGVVGLVFDDANGNGARDATEVGLAGVQVQITNGAFTTTVTTAADGTWLAVGVPAGTATVDVLEASLPPGATHSAGLDPSTVVVLTTATVDAGVDGYTGLLADVATTKTGPPSALAGDTLRYVIVSGNAGPESAPNVVVRDTLPAGVTFVAASRGGVAAAGVVTWPAITLAAGASVTDTVRVLAPANPATIVNVAVSSASRADPNAANNNGSVPAARVTTTIGAKADLAITKTDGRTSVDQLDPLTYTIVVTNPGPSTVTAASVTDTFPAALTGVSWTCTGSGGGTCGAAAGTGHILGVLATLPAGASVTFTATGTAAQTGLLTNTARVAAPAGVTDPNSANNSATDNNTTVVAQPLTFTSAADQTFTVGDPTTAISLITIRDATGTATIKGVTDLRIRIPAGISMVWDTLDVSAVLGEAGASKVSPAVRYEDGGKTLVLDVLTDFVPGERLTVSALSFTAFTAPSLLQRLELEVGNDNLVSATDARTKRILSSQGACVADPVTTVAELRAAIADIDCATVNVVPGTYLLTADGNGQLPITRSVTIRNTGGGRVVIDANNQSRVFFVKDVAGPVTLEGLTITRGSVAAHAAGLHCENTTLTIRQSTISGNTTTGNGRRGAGLYSKGCATTLINSTVSENTHLGGSDGGGIYIDGGTVTLTNTTVANNTAPNRGGGIYMNNNGLVLTNSLVADNASPTEPQIYVQSGTITSNGYNLVEGGCVGCLASDRIADPSLGPLADNGGNSYTQALLPGSPAINTALTASAPATDQRAVARPQGTAADIGAYETAYPGVVVTPDGAQALKRVPSNGTNYTATLVVTNTGAGGSSFGLKAFPRPAAAITIVSVNGVAGDTTNVTVAAGAALSVPVVYSIGNVAAGIADTLFLRATAAGFLTVRDTGFVDLAVVRPSLTTVKSVTPSSTTAPGADLTYLITFANTGGASASSVVVVDSLPAQVMFKVGSVSSSLPAGVNAVVEYWRSGGSAWDYAPVSGGCGAPTGYDGCVTRVRWRLLDPLGFTAPSNAGTVGFVTRVR